MKPILVVFTTFIGCFGVAEDSRLLDLPDFSKVSAPAQGEKKINVEVSCKNADGRSLKQGEAGYEACVTATQSDISKKMNSSESTSTGPSTNFQLKFGK